MKKSYKKPLAVCENFVTGEIVTNSAIYAQKVQQKREKLQKNKKKEFGVLQQEKDLQETN